MKRLIFTLPILFSIIHLSATEVVQTSDLTFYYPDFNSIDLTLGSMPTSSDSRVTFCCEAAFTGQRLSTFAHTNVADAHVSSGTWHKGYNCRANTGAFVWYGDKWAFMDKTTFLNTHPTCRMAFCQFLIILNSSRRRCGNVCGRTEPDTALYVRRTGAYAWWSRERSSHLNITSNA